jgi:hypothetical protein
LDPTFTITELLQSGLVPLHEREYHHANAIWYRFLEFDNPLAVTLLLYARQTVLVAHLDQDHLDAVCSMRIRQCDASIRCLAQMVH